MSSAEVFSCALLLKGADRAAQILNLLERGQREEVKVALEAIKSTPPEGIRQLWCERRVTEDLLQQQAHESCLQM